MTISHDALSKLLFSSEILVRDLLLGLIEDEWLHSLDFTTLEKVPSEFVSDDLKHRTSDVIWRVQAQGQWVYIYVLIEFQRNDAKSARLLHVYLDSRFPGWREAAHGNAHAGQGRATSSAAITKEEAYEILGLQMGASEEEIRKAHRTLMKKLHPDQGGSTYLATRVNLAKDVLLGSHHS